VSKWSGELEATLVCSFGDGKSGPRVEIGERTTGEGECEESPILCKFLAYLSLDRDRAVTVMAAETWTRRRMMVAMLCAA